LATPLGNTRLTASRGENRGQSRIHHHIDHAREHATDGDGFFQSRVPLDLMMANEADDVADGERADRPRDVALHAGDTYAMRGGDEYGDEYAAEYAGDGAGGGGGYCGEAGGSDTMPSSPSVTQASSPIHYVSSTEDAARLRSAASLAELGLSLEPTVFADIVGGSPPTRLSKLQLRMQRVDSLESASREGSPHRRSSVGSSVAAADQATDQVERRMQCPGCGHRWLDKHHKDECPKCLVPLSTPDWQRNRRLPGEVSTYKHTASSAMESCSGLCPRGGQHHWRLGRCAKCGRGEGGTSWKDREGSVVVLRDQRASMGM